MRFFAAIPIPDHIQDILGSVQEADRSEIRWVVKHHFHLTLKFLGSVSEKSLESLEASLGQIRFSSFRLQLEGLGRFPEKGSVRVLWAGVSQSRELFELQKRVEQATEFVTSGKSGKDRSTFVPHITLGRTRAWNQTETQAYLKRRSGLIRGTFTADRFHLFESRQGKNGVEYRTVGIYRAGEV